MDVIVHEAVAKHSYTKLLPELTKRSEIAPPIIVCKKYGVSIVPALHDMVWVIWDRNAGSSGHECLCGTVQ